MLQLVVVAVVSFLFGAVFGTFKYHQARWRQQCARQFTHAVDAAPNFQTWGVGGAGTITQSTSFVVKTTTPVITAPMSGVDAPGGCVR